MHITHIKAGPLTAQTARAQSRQGAFVTQLSQRVGLIHELGELAGAKELTQGSHNRADVNEADRRDLILIADGHTLFDHTFHTAHTNAQFVLDQLTHGLDTAVAEMIDIVFVLDLIINEDHAAHQIDNIPFGHAAVRNGDAVTEVKLLVQFIAANAFQVIVTHIEDLLFEELTGVFQVGRVTGAHAAEEFDQCRLSDGLPVAQIPDWFLANGLGNKGTVRIVINIMEQGNELFVGAVLDGAVTREQIINCSQCTQEDGDGHSTLAVEFEDNEIFVSGLKFHPCTAIRDQFGHSQTTSGSAIYGSFKVNARRTNKL